MQKNCTVNASNFTQITTSHVSVNNFTQITISGCIHHECLLLSDDYD